MPKMTEDDRNRARTAEMLAADFSGQFSDDGADDPDRDPRATRFRRGLHFDRVTLALAGFQGQQRFVLWRYFPPRHPGGGAPEAEETGSERRSSRPVSILARILRIPIAVASTAAADLTATAAALDYSAPTRQCRPVGFRPGLLCALIWSSSQAAVLVDNESGIGRILPPDEARPVVRLHAATVMEMHGVRHPGLRLRGL